MFDGFIIKTVAYQNITYSWSAKKEKKVSNSKSFEHKLDLYFNEVQTYQALRLRCGCPQERGFSSSLWIAWPGSVMEGGKGVIADNRKNSCVKLGQQKGEDNNAHTPFRLKRELNESYLVLFWHSKHIKVTETNSHGKKQSLKCQVCWQPVSFVTIF